jgi:nitrate reductase NapE component
MQPLRDDLNWFQTKSLDVILFLALVCVTLLAVVIVTLLFVCKWLMQLIQQKRQIPHAKTG